MFDWCLYLQRSAPQHVAIHDLGTILLCEEREVECVTVTRESAEAKVSADVNAQLKFEVPFPHASDAKRQTRRRRAGNRVTVALAK